MNSALKDRQVNPKKICVQKPKSIKLFAEMVEAEA